MTEEKKDSKKEEVVDSSEKSTDKKQPDKSPEEDTSQKTEVEEDETKQLKEELEKERKKSSDFQQAYLKEKKKREDEIQLPKQSVPQDDDEDEYTSDQRKLVRDELDKREDAKNKENLSKGIKLFIESNPQYSPDNDINDANWGKLKPLIESTHFSGSPEEVASRIEILHRGITQDSKPTPPVSDTEVEDTGVGDVPTPPGGEEKKADALTRPLNRVEQMAMAQFPGKTKEEREKGYRESLAKLEESRKKKE
jgi:hypothetical protein